MIVFLFGGFMPKDNETRPCTHANCSGTQTFATLAALPDEHFGKTGLPMKRKPAWVCDNDNEHFDGVKATGAT